MAAVYFDPNGPYVQGSTPTISMQLVDTNKNPIPGSVLDTLVFTLAAWNGAAPWVPIDDIENINILNTDRGTIDENGNLTVNLLSSDTQVATMVTPLVQRAVIVRFTLNNGTSEGGQIVVFTIQTSL